MPLTSAQIGAFDTTNGAWQAFDIAKYYASPIVLDLNGKGVQTQSINAGVKFDISDTGTAVKTGWAAVGEGFLVLDRNNDGTITNGSEMFGTATKLANGLDAINGYQALAQ